MTIKFYKTADPYGAFNNFKKSPFYLYGRWWRNVEAAYQAQKPITIEECEMIWAAATPREAKDLGQQVSLRPGWDSIKFNIMKECVLAKFLQNPELKELLLSTGEEEIVENSPYDIIWGCGIHGNGQNHLGKILMETRQILRGADIYK